MSDALFLTRRATNLLPYLGQHIYLSVPKKLGLLGAYNSCDKLADILGRSAKYKKGWEYNHQKITRATFWRQALDRKCYTINTTVMATYLSTSILEMMALECLRHFWEGVLFEEIS